MIRKRTFRTTNHLKRIIYESPETNIQVAVTEYLPNKMVDVEFLPIIKKRIKETYLNTIKKKRKKSNKEIYSYIVDKIYRLYFEFIIEKCIQGYAVFLGNDERYVFKVYGYYPNEVEKKRISQIQDKYEKFGFERKETYAYDFYLKKYRIGLFKRIDNTDFFKYYDYFLNINMKYKKKLIEQVEKDPSIYDNIQFQL